MISFLKKATAVLLLTLFIGVSPAMASGKMEVRIGERVDLVGESSDPSAQYKWVVKKGNEIMSTQTGRNFSFNFPVQGEYTVNLTSTSGTEIESTVINVLSGARYPRPFGEEGLELIPGVAPLRLFLETLPYRSSDGSISLLGTGKVYFLLVRSIGEILEYRIDKNIFTDSDGNGTANDDIDNADDDSYLTGQSWITGYEEGEAAKIVAEATLVDKDGKKAKEQVEIVFGEMRDTGDPIAFLDVLPTPDPDDNLVHLYEDPHEVAFYARRSEGKILEYRIDKNIFADSDGDGDPKNDIDNLNDISFKTGDIWETEYSETDEQIIAQLIVVGEGGKGSRIQKGIVFGEKPAPYVPTLEDIEEEGIRLTADKDFVVKGDPITFTVAGLELALDQYTFEWDFDGDGEIDKEIEGVNSVDHIYEAPGIFEIKVVITDHEGNTAERTLEIISKDALVTKADFSFEVDGNTVSFENLSTVAMNLADKRLDYQWSFGDTDEAGYAEQRDQIGLENPVYTYAYAGKYLVTLTVTDADQVMDSKSAEIEILQGLAPLEAVEEVVEEKEAVEGSVFVKLLKIFLYLILIVVVLVFLIVGGFMAFLKVQHPDLTFEELVDEFKSKLLAMMGAHEMAEKPIEGPIEGPIEEAPRPSEPEAPEAPEPEVEEEPMEEAAEEPAEPVETAPMKEAEAGPAPSWMKEKPTSASAMEGKEVIEGEVEEPIEEPIEDTIEEPVPEPPTTAEEEVPATEEPSTEKTPPPSESEAPEAPKEKEPPSDEGPSAPPPSEPPAGGEPSEPPAPEEPSESEKGPVPDWLKGV